MANRRRDQFKINTQAVPTVHAPDRALNDTNGDAPGRASERQREASKGSADNNDFRVRGVHHV
ncbi:hypothetical protein D3C87_1592530 [compost metagenome]